jgi:CHRD domain-containing protein
VIRKRHLAFGALAVTALVFGLTASVGAQGSGDRAIFAVMNGAKEVDVSGHHGTGDKNGHGSFSATLDGRELCYGIQVKNINNPVAAHIHRGGRDVAGPVVQPLEQPTTGDPGASSACVRVSRSLARGLRNRPGRFYVNVHTADLPNGAVRGQLFARSR